MKFICDACEPTAQRLKDERDTALSDLAEARAALTELFSWVKNWSPSFTEDGEWPDTEAKVKRALAPPTLDEEQRS